MTLEQLLSGEPQELLVYVALDGQAQAQVYEDGHGWRVFKAATMAEAIRQAMSAKPLSEPGDTEIDDLI